MAKQAWSKFNLSPPSVVAFNKASILISFHKDTILISFDKDSILISYIIRIQIW